MDITKLQMPQWYAFATRARHEKKVNEHLQSAGMESFLPVRKTLNQWKDRKKWIESPLFPSYIFAKIPYKNRLDVLTLPSVIDIVGINNQPCPVRPEEIEAIKLLLNSNSGFDVNMGLSMGNRVRICSGPLIGLEGVIAQIRGGTRVVFNISALGKSIVINASDYKIKHLD